MKNTFFALSLAASVLPAHAADWAIAFGASTIERAFFIDLGSVRKDGVAVTIWVKAINGPASKSRFVNEVFRYRFDCSERTLNIVASTQYMKDGTSRSSSKPVANIPLVPDSVGDVLANAVCKGDFPERLDKATVERLAPNTPEEAAKAWFDAHARATAEYMNQAR